MNLSLKVIHPLQEDETCKIRNKLPRMIAREPEFYLEVPEEYLENDSLQELIRMLQQAQRARAAQTVISTTAFIKLAPCSVRIFLTEVKQVFQQ